MNPDQHSRAKQLDEQHRRLNQDLKRWAALHEPPDIIALATGHGTAAVLPVEINTWLGFRAAVMQQLRTAIAGNREQFEAL